MKKRFGNIAKAVVAGGWMSLSMATVGAAEKVMTAQEVKTFQEKLTQTAVGTKSLTADFVQVKHADVFVTDIRSDGTFYYEKPEKVSLAYKKPMAYRMIIADGKLTTESGGHKMSMNLAGNKMMGTLSDMLSACMTGDLSRIGDGYALWYGTADGGRYVVKVSPKDTALKAYLSEIRIEIDPGNMSVKVLRFVEAGGDYTEYVFKNERVNEAIAASVWKVD